SSVIIYSHILLLLFSLFTFFYYQSAFPPHLYTLSLHDALPISIASLLLIIGYGEHLKHMSYLLNQRSLKRKYLPKILLSDRFLRSEEHTSELQSRFDLVCRLLLEKKNTITLIITECHDRS